jgi:transcription elongation factor GreA-like protein
MSREMAISSLEPLQKQDIRVMKATKPKEELVKNILEKVEESLKIIIKSYGKADLKMIKAVLVPSVLTIAQWPSWSTKAKDILQNNALFSHVPGKKDFYTVIKSY